MASERKWFTVSQAFTANGAANGKITVADVAGFYVKSQVRIVSTAQNPQLLEIKRIEGTTDIYVGRIGESIDDRVNVSAYLVADSATITLNEQKISTIKPEDILQAVYEREPAVAIRTLLVDRYGRPFTTTNPLPVNAAVTLSDEPIKISGTENGQPNGPEFPFVNNLRLQILQAKDRTANISYADFGTKNQRVTQIDYTAPSIGTGVGYTARLTLSYTLVSGRYRRDSMTWSLV